MDEYHGYRFLGARSRRWLGVALAVVVLLAAALLWVRQEGGRRLDSAERQAQSHLRSAEPAAHPPVPAQENAATAFRDAASRRGAVPHDRRILRQVGGRAPGTWSPAEEIALREVMARQRETRELLSAAAAGPQARFGSSEPGESWDHALAFFNAERLLTAEVRVAAADKDAAAALQALATLRWLTEALYADTAAAPLALRIENAAVGALRDALAMGLRLEVPADQILPRTDPRQAHRRSTAWNLREAVHEARRPGGPAHLLTGGPDRPFWWPWIVAATGPWLVADALRPDLAALATDDEPYPRAAARIDAAAPGWFAPLSFDTRSAPRQLLLARTTLAARQLAGLALAASAAGGAGVAAEASPPDPILGEPPRALRDPDGSTRLAYPAAARWVAEHEPALADLLDWKLPPA